MHQCKNSNMQSQKCLDDSTMIWRLLHNITSSCSLRIGSKGTRRKFQDYNFLSSFHTNYLWIEKGALLRENFQKLRDSMRTIVVKENCSFSCAVTIIAASLKRSLAMKFCKVWHAYLFAFFMYTFYSLGHSTWEETLVMPLFFQNSYPHLNSSIDALQNMMRPCALSFV